jgi:hypothetical protein
MINKLAIQSQIKHNQATKTCQNHIKAFTHDRAYTTRNPLIHDEILMTFFDFVIDHTASTTKSQISSKICSAGYEAQYVVQTL